MSRIEVRRWLPTLTLLVLAAATAIALRQFDEATKPEGRPRVDTPDFFMEEFVTTFMGPDGSPDRTLKARELVHFPSTNTKELEEPYLIMYQTDAPAWHVRSERGWISAAGDVVILLGAVHVWRIGDSGERLIDIHTRDLRILPATDYGETDKPVTIRTADQRSVGVGMRAFLTESRLELLAQVRTHVTGHLQESRSGSD
ncbi:MAG: LPS export ABC transporter periplasmic protein LptC [Pseudomonadota bacterium]